MNAIRLSVLVLATLLASSHSWAQEVVLPDRDAPAGDLAIDSGPPRPSPGYVQLYSHEKWALIVQDEKGVLFRVGMNGEVELRDGTEPSEAARVFWKAYTEIYPVVCAEIEKENHEETDSDSAAR